MSTPRLVLQVGPHATLEEARSSYLRLARMYHPDKCGNEQQQFLAVQRAWEQLQREEQTSRPAPQLVDLDDLEHRADGFVHQCRCGDKIVALEGELAQGVNTYACASCSLCIQIQYEVCSD